ncbi:unnamed protein product [Thelazia callipaeda]|uniref:ANK_REP_REGION domain-containing protein n=1 Tax=Thelazia callipaeda TaxID=103827 RepID=A0A0N5D950_THECL|nr:unnamed protein product [Thelazia callipaeda]
MVNFLLQQGANINQRCYGASFCPEDQISSRTDSLEHEYVELSLKTSYAGRMYFGEYPLSFAACTNQTDCFRLLMAKKADPNRKDTNGNTVLHLAVIHEKPEMIKLSYDMGAKLQIVNNQNFTPLTLAAHLAKKEMFEQILKLEAHVVWTYGNASSYAYPLARIDTIDQETGNLNEDSALSLIVYGATTKHLELLDGLLEELLQAKWEAFGRRYLTLSFSCFVVFYACIFTAFMCRPFTMVPEAPSHNQDGLVNTSKSCNDSSDPNCRNFTIFDALMTHNIQNPEKSSSTETGGSLLLQDDCQLWLYFGRGWQQYVRLVTESAVLSMAVLQIIGDVIDLRNVGHSRWWRVLVFIFVIFYNF